MLPFPAGPDNQTLAPGTSVEQGGKKENTVGGGNADSWSSEHYQDADATGKH